MTMGSMFPTKVRSLFLRRSSGSATSTRSKDSSASSTTANDQSPTQERQKRPKSSRSRSSLVVPRARHTVAATLPEEDEPAASQIATEASQADTDTDTHTNTTEIQPSSNIPPPNTRLHPVASPLPLPTPEPSPLSRPGSQHEDSAPTVTVQVPSPPDQQSPSTSEPRVPERASSRQIDLSTVSATAAPLKIQSDSSTTPRPLSAGKRPLFESRPRSPLYQTFLAREHGVSAVDQAGDYTAPRQSIERPSRDYEPTDYFSASPSTLSSRPKSPMMAQSPSRHPQAYAQPRKRRIWVKRPGASATMVTINEEDMVDDARDMILRKYANSLGKSFDSPDVTLRIHPRQQSHSASQRSSTGQQITPSPLQEERVLRPDEILSRTLDVYFPGGQSVEEALLIDVPPPPPSRRRRTPGHSPGMLTAHAGTYGNQYEQDSRPTESDKDYFPPVMLTTGRAAAGAHSPSVIGQLPILGPGNHPHSIAVLNGAQLPPLPSPGATERALGAMPGEGRRRHTGRPKVGRTHTSSPTVVQTASHVVDSRPNIATTASIPPPPVGTPPHPGTGHALARTATPPPRVSSPRPKPGKRPKKQSTGPGPLATPGSAGILATVPPINVLVVEDNIINLRLLEAFLKRLKVRSHSAMNGREAVNKWRQGGFHLVLMDIQLPIMNGLEATKEIRRLEKVNGVGAFVKSAEEERAEKGRQKEEGSETTGEISPEDEEKEKERNLLGNRELFKSPVIIVALTASSLHSDRSEALAAGCNDFLTKPVNLAWLERKLKEWGCMQALIDFEGWRKWKDFQSTPVDNKSAPKSAGKAASHRLSSSVSSLRAAQINDSKPVPSSTDPAAVAAGVTAPPANNPTSAALQDLNAKAESQDSTATLDSMTSDDADSIDTAMPPRPTVHRGPQVTVQTATPRQSVEGHQVPRVDTAGPGTRSTSVSPPVGSSANSPRSISSLSLSSPLDSANDRADAERDRSVERRRRKNRSSLGQTGLTAVEEREGEESRGEVEVGA